MENPAILLRRLNPYYARAKEGAASLCQTRAHAEILPEHWLLKLLEQEEGDLTVLARRYEWDMDAPWQDLLGWLDNQPRSVRSRPQLSEERTTRSWSVNQASVKPRWLKHWRCVLQRATCLNRSSQSSCIPLISASCRRAQV